MAETIHIRGEAGNVFELSLPLHEVIAERLSKGYLTRVNPDGTDWVEDAARTKPPVAASKAEWVGWAVYNGAKPDDAEALTKTDLIEKYGV